MSVYKFVDEIENSKDFEKFLNLLYEEYTKNGDTWENNNLESYLEALLGSNFRLENEVPTWKKFATMLVVAIVYE